MEDYSLEGIDSILDAFKVSPKSRYISLKKAETKINLWKNHLSLFDDIKEEEMSDEFNGGSFNLDEEF